jgi:hypothetical protein
MSNVTVWLSGNRWAARKNGAAGFVFADTPEQAEARAQTWATSHPNLKPEKSVVWKPRTSVEQGGNYV